jgi:VWFA-related protein
MRNKRSRFGLGLALAVAAGLGLAAQGAPASQVPAVPQSRPAPTPRATVRQPDFRSSVDVVTMDAIVRNNQDQFVADLTKADFEVFEDGVRQEIASLTLVHGGRVYNLQDTPLPPAREGIILPPSRPRNDATGRIFAIIVDDLHLDFQNTGRIIDLFKRISKTLVHEGDMFGIVSTGPSSLAIDLTYDRKILDDAIKKISGNGLKPSEIIQGAEGAQGPSEVRHRAHVAFTTALA